jgi:hypothetical protein
MQTEGSRHSEESIEAIRRQIQSEIMGKMKDDRSVGAVARAKAEAEAKAKYVLHAAALRTMILLELSGHDRIQVS